ncbi:hypothetical protein SARC_04854 [Sphaeroforma arctica JP610]|uniref:Glucosidase II subunit alpha n=1 Tax=Sphaeroforma arctica JP610 TaxID=667725 RepID=A0A0L0G1A1_9EUKA|nr:hypothetical protein SARC_04854 [Sphaeroforma arctica JP610]KNC82875.1 hypothetical protein SARC_04854 [Sphaeroforma arctica JP610]|eukprot:XP_014156777.1 hypothetical protein SARC_04854 [Sphaeroforma arctica JP610]
MVSSRRTIWVRAVVLFALTTAAFAVERSNFKTCAQSDFCRRNEIQLNTKGETRYTVQADSFALGDGKATAELVDSADDSTLVIDITAVADGVARLRILEESPVRPRYEVPDVITEYSPLALKIVEQDSAHVVVTSDDIHTVELQFDPFVANFYRDGKLLTTTNSMNQLAFEQLQTKPEHMDEPAKNEAGAYEDEAAGVAYEAYQRIMKSFESEQFKNFPDSKPYGDQSVAMDIAFPGSDHVYGIPEHADTLALKDTEGNGDPYRLFNLDVFEFELYNPMALYGAVPYMISHAIDATVGVLWLNAAETWVSIKNDQDASGAVKRTRWVSESGIIELYVMMGASPAEVSKKYISLTGPTAMPPKWSLGYHQCRWNYNNMEDVSAVCGRCWCGIHLGGVSKCAFAYMYMYICMHVLNHHLYTDATFLFFSNNTQLQYPTTHTLTSEHKERPFVLSRAFFAGTQRYGAIWTGDNMATWEHLRVSPQMLLSINLAGIAFSGVDIGGFFGNPDTELFVRWYQAAVFYPFFRAHAHIDTNRREPWLVDTEAEQRIRTAARQRYQLLEYWYTLFFQSHTAGEPPIRPIWYHYPNDSSTFAMDDGYLVGRDIFVNPIYEQGATSKQLYLPGPELWYPLWHVSKSEEGANQISLAVTMDTVPAYQRGGSIIPMQMRPRRNSVTMKNDPYTLRVALDAKGMAEGQLFVDDGSSTAHETGSYALRQFSFSNGQLKSSAAQPEGSHVAADSTFTAPNRVERVVVLGLKTRPTKVSVSEGASLRELAFKFDAATEALTIRDPATGIVKDWELTIA